MTDYATLTGPELAAAFNVMARAVGQPEIKKFKDRATGVKRCQTIAKLLVPAAPAKSKIEQRYAGVSITKALANPRRPGTKAHDLFAKMAKMVSESTGGVSLLEVMMKTGYRREDYEWDLSRGDIVISKE